MIRFVWLACLCFVALSTLAFADSIDYQAAGTLGAHTAFTRGQIRQGSTWEVGTQLIEITNLTTHQVQTGNLGVIDVTTGSLFRCSLGFCFSGGSLDIDNLAGKDLFHGELLSGNISTLHGITILDARLAFGATTVIREGHGTFSSQALIQRHVAVVPESGTLGLLGTGLLGLGFVRYRRLSRA